MRNNPFYLIRETTEQDPLFCCKSIDISDTGFFNYQHSLATGSDIDASFMSFFIRPKQLPSTATNSNLFFISSNLSTNTLQVGLSTTGQIKVSNYDSVGAIWSYTSTAVIGITSFSHIMINLDINSGLGQLYINGVIETITGFGDYSMDRGINEFRVHFTTKTTKSRPYLAQIFFDVDVSADLTQAATVAKFADDDNYPVSLGADGSTPFGSQPFFFIPYNISGTTVYNYGSIDNLDIGGAGTITESTISPCMCS